MTVRRQHLLIRPACSVVPYFSLHVLPQFFSGKTGFHGDLNGTYPVGKVDAESEKLIRTTRQSLDEAIKICKPGALFRDIGKVMYVSWLPSGFLRTEWASDQRLSRILENQSPKPLAAQ